MRAATFVAGRRHDVVSPDRLAISAGDDPSLVTAPAERTPEQGHKPHQEKHQMHGGECLRDQAASRPTGHRLRREPDDGPLPAVLGGGTHFDAPDLTANLR